MKKHYVCSGIGTSPQVAKLAGGLTVYDGAVIMLTKEDAARINDTAKDYLGRLAARAEERKEEPPNPKDVLVLTVKKAPAAVLAAIEAEREIEEIASSIDVRTPQEKIAELVEDNSREELDAIAEALGVEAPASFKDKKTLAAAIVGYGDPTSESS